MDEHSFSVQLKSKNNVKNVCLGDNSEILFEGYLGDLESLAFIDDSLIEIQGSKGVLRFDLTLEQVYALLNQREEAY